MISWSKRFQWPSRRSRHMHSSPPLCVLLLLGRFRAAQYRCSPLFPLLGPRRKIKTRRIVPRPGLLFIICGHVSFRCGPGCHMGLCLVRALPAHSSSSTTGLLQHPSTVHLHRSKPSSEGPLGLSSVGRLLTVACCRCYLSFWLGRLSLEFLGQLASMGLCLAPLCGCRRSLRLCRRASCRPHLVRFRTNMTSPTTSKR
jgi:hypothetical protein